MALFENIEFSVADELKDLDELSNLISPDFGQGNYFGLKLETVDDLTTNLEMPKTPDSIGTSPSDLSSRPSSGQSTPTLYSKKNEETFPSPDYLSPSYPQLPYYGPTYTPTQYSNSPTQFSSPQQETYSMPPPTPYYENLNKSPESQIFFPPTFPASNPAFGHVYTEPIWNRGLSDYLQSDYHQVEQNTNFSLSPMRNSQSSLKTRRRASRSKCPCIKCCNARANCIPSPATHACMVKGCSKTYTRPAHLRAHLKSHENDSSPKCEICHKTVMSAELFIVHMFEHGKEMKL